ncbi:MAG: hypothetical protein IKR39_01550 [Lachnospiraceae bacterium]|nr:hypothetical protein [Lachnospiraceae bacterium]
MAVRPAWSIKDHKIIRQDFEFAWNSGLNIKQKQKNVDALHESIRNKTGESALEVSSKGRVPLGVSLSAFNLEYHGFKVENVFQASKSFAEIGPNRGILGATPGEAKAYANRVHSFALKAFVLDEVEWPLEPKTAFYDYLYVSAVYAKYGEALDVSEYSWYTDIEFNPQKSINCQARALAVYKLLQAEGDFGVLSDKDKWMEFHKATVLG